VAERLPRVTVRASSLSLSSGTISSSGAVAYEDNGDGDYVKSSDLGASAI
jgi:hypothetical protein